MKCPLKVFLASNLAQNTPQRGGLDNYVIVFTIDRGIPTYLDSFASYGRNRAISRVGPMLNEIKCAFHEKLRSSHRNIPRNP